MTNRFAAAFLAAAMLAAGTANAAFVGDGAPAGGFTGKQAAQSDVLSVKEAVGIRGQDDRYVTLEGYIVEQLNDDEYRFRDSTGECVVDIDDDDFRGQRVDTKTKVRLLIELDDRYKGEFDVERLTVVR